MRRVTLPHTIRDAIGALYALPTTSQRSVKAPTSLEVAARRLPFIDTPTIIPRLTKARLASVVAPLTASFCPGLGS